MCGKNVAFAENTERNNGNRDLSPRGQVLAGSCRKVNGPLERPFLFIEKKRDQVTFLNLIKIVVLEQAVFSCRGHTVNERGFIHKLVNRGENV